MKTIITAFIFLLNSSLIISQNLWEVYTTSNSGICSDTVLSVYIDNTGNVWFGTMRGVSKFGGNSWISYTSNNSPLTEDVGISTIAEYDGNYYFGGHNYWGVIKFDGENWNGIPGINNITPTIAFDDNGNLWMGDYTGITKFDGINTENFNTSNSPLPSNHIMEIKKDRSGNIWVAMTGDYMSHNAGIAKYYGNNWQIFNSQNSALTNENVYSITEDKNGNLWFGTDSLLLFKYDGVNWTRYDLSEQPTSNWISSLDADSDGNIWAGLGFSSSERGIIKFDGEFITRYGIDEGFPVDGDVFDLKVDENNSVWIGTWDGLVKLNNDPQINIEALSESDSLRSLSNINILWEVEFENNVNIEYTTDNGSNWIMSSSNVPSEKKYTNWIVPIVAPASDECLIRISDVNDPGIKVESGKFTIYAKVETPVFTPDGGVKFNGINISVLCATDSSEIYYTTDGSEPSQSSIKYSGSFYINKNTTLKAKAFKQDWIESEVNSSQYQMKAAPVLFNPQSGTYTYAQQVSLTTQTNSAVIHYTLNGTDPDQESTVYNDPININVNSVIKAIAYRENFESSIVTEGNYSFTGSAVNAVIKTDSVWIDSDFNGYEERMVDGSESTITNDTFYYLIWTVNGDSAGNGAQVNLKLKTGTNEITLHARGYTGAHAESTVLVNVYAAKLKTHGAIHSAVAQLDDNTFFATSTDDKVYQFDSTGSVNWNILTGGSIQSTTCISDQNNIYVGSTDTRLYSFDQNGVPKWDKAMGGIITSSPSAGKDGVVYVGISTGRLYALDAAGNVKWNVQTGGAIVSSPAVSLTGDVYVGSCDKKLYSVDKDGQINWIFTTGDTILSSPAVGNDSCIVFGSNDGYLYKLTQDGNKKWSYFAGGKIKSSPIILNHGEIIFGNSNNEIVCVDKHGDLAWKYITNGPVSGTAAISSGGQIVVGDENGVLYNLDPLGIMQWYFQSNSSIESPILITNNNLAIFGNLNGDVYTLKLDPGQSLYVEPVKYEWPTFKGNNKRTGNKSEVLTGINDNYSNTITEYKLSQNYPNPFNPSTTINYNIPAAGLVTLKVYDVLGREVATLVNEEKNPGRYEVRFDGSSLSSGLYFYRITSNSYTEIKKMLLMK